MNPSFFLVTHRDFLFVHPKVTRVNFRMKCLYITVKEEIKINIISLNSVPEPLKL